MTNYSRVSNKQYFQVHNGSKDNFKESVSGWYIGGTVQTGKKFPGKQATIHLLQPNGEIFGVNTTVGFTKQFLGLGGCQLNPIRMLVGKFIEIKGGDPVQTARGSFTPIESRELPAPADLPVHGFEVVPFVDIDNIRDMISSNSNNIPQGVVLSANDIAGNSELVEDNNSEMGLESKSVGDNIKDLDQLFGN